MPTRFENTRRELSAVLGQRPSPENITALMLDSKEGWNAVNHMAIVVLKELRRLKHAREEQHAVTR